MIDAQASQTAVNNQRTSAASDTNLTQPRSLDVLAADLMRIRPSISDIGVRSKVSLLIGQCRTYRPEMRADVERNIDRIAADWQG